MIIDYTQAILRLVPNAGFQLTADDLSTLNWESDPDLRPSDAEIEESLIQLQIEYDAQEYARNRQAEYPSITDVTIALAEKMEGNSTMWDTITAQRLDVKSKFPKP